jgi:sn-glycerol 3-phosphate transport system permease protein
VTAQTRGPAEAADRGTATDASRADRPARPTPRHGRDHALAYLFLVPSTIVFALFVVWPLGDSVYLSLHGSDLFGGASVFVGLDNYRDMFTSAEFGKVLLNTLEFVLLTVIPGVLGALVVVLLLEAQIRGTRVLRTAFALPFAFSVATASVIFSVIYNYQIGLANGILGFLGIGKVGWTTDPHVAMFALALTTVWMNLGYNVLVLSAGVGSIPAEVMEAARLDGASGLKLVRRIILPLLSPQLFFLVVVTTIQSLQSFGQIHILTKGGPDGSTTTLVYSIYKKAFAFGSSDFGTASAQAMVLLVIVLACTGIQFGVLQRKVHY